MSSTPTPPESLSLTSLRDELVLIESRLNQILRSYEKVYKEITYVPSSAWAWNSSLLLMAGVCLQTIQDWERLGKLSDMLKLRDSLEIHLTVLFKLSASSSPQTYQTGDEK
jgi:hypothetical protein